MFILLSGPQAQRKRAQQALQGAGFKVVLDRAGDPIPDSFGHAPGRETRWSGASYSKADVERLDEDQPGHGIRVGDVIRASGRVEAVETKHPMCFLSVEGEESRVNDAESAVAELKWHVRAYFERPAARKPLSIEKRLARIGLTLPELQKALGS